MLVVAAMAAAAMAALARPFRRGPGGLGTALRQGAAGGPWGRARPGTQVAGPAPGRAARPPPGTARNGLCGEAGE